MRRAPVAALAGIVTDIAGYREMERGNFRQWEPASLVVPLVISFAGPFGIGIGSGAVIPWRSFAAGLWAGPVTIESGGDAWCLQVNFTPLGARRFFGVPMSEIARRLVEPEVLLGPAFLSLRDRLGDMPDWEARFRLVESFIAARLLQAPAPSAQVAQAYRHIVASGGRALISRVAAEVAWSRKHLAEKFADEVGLTPKTVARIVRLERAIALSRAGTEAGWADIAAACGFADQPHLAGEFQALAGATPTEFMARAA
ncbi:MAG TPA: AraC family transcriptional regulator [Rhizobiaceae bacterium]|nr:AraC family transcriptional regulator [Rhizobiaceae bacterium]